MVLQSASRGKILFLKIRTKIISDIQKINIKFTKYLAALAADIRLLSGMVPLVDVLAG